MIEIRAERCTGCGECVDVCPAGALYLVEGKAVVDDTLCRECEACLSACPANAIVRNPEVYADSIDEAHVPATQPAQEVVPSQSRIVAVPRGSRVLPWLGMALVWAGREIVPRLAEHVLYGLDRRMANWQATDIQSNPPDAEVVLRSTDGGHRHRRRRGS